MAEYAYNMLKSEHDLICFSDKDESKHGTEIKTRDGRKMMIMPLVDAMQKYRKAKLWVTPAEPLKFEIMNEMFMFMGGTKNKF
jgi:hypothetical protein